MSLFPWRHLLCSEIMEGIISFWITKLKEFDLIKYWIRLFTKVQISFSYAKLGLVWTCITVTNLFASQLQWSNYLNRKVLHKTLKFVATAFEDNFGWTPGTPLAWPVTTASVVVCKTISSFLNSLQIWEISQTNRGQLATLLDFLF